MKWIKDFALPMMMIAIMVLAVTAGCDMLGSALQTTHQTLDRVYGGRIVHTGEVKAMSIEEDGALVELDDGELYIVESYEPVKVGDPVLIVREEDGTLALERQIEVQDE